MQVMIDLQLEEINITFENNTKQKRNPNVEQNKSTVLPLLCFSLLARKYDLPEILW